MNFGGLTRFVNPSQGEPFNKRMKLLIYKDSPSPELYDEAKDVGLGPQAAESEGPRRQDSGRCGSH